MTTQKISIITPSYGQLDWLKLCVASVADQIAPEKQDASAAQKIEDGSWKIGGSSFFGGRLRRKCLSRKSTVDSRELL